MSELEILEIGESIGWNHGEAQVHRAVWNGRDAVLKRFAKPKKYACEVYGYRVWQKHMPRLLHADLEHMRLVFERIDAECALKVPQTAAMYVAAGTALRRMHDDAPRGVPFDDGKLDLLHRPWPPTVLRHCDYTARNWLWDGARLTVIDPEHCRPGPAVLDMAKMHNDGLPPELAQAFQFGYGRPWTPQESTFLTVALCFQALTLGVWCSEHGDPQGVRAMQAALDRLLP